MMLEAAAHAGNSFVTLTYTDAKLPEGGTLRPVDVQLWLKRLRFEYGAKLRFYLVGEYGNDSFRPHYHAALFGYATCIRGRTEKRQHLEGRSCCGPCDLIRDTWTHGGIDLGDLTPQSSSYICGYVLKKMTKKEDPRLCGRHPEFARMSLKPGIGAYDLKTLSNAVSSATYADSLKRDMDVPLTLMRGRKSMPLGRYLRRKLREEIGRSPDTPESVLGRYIAEVHTLLQKTKEEAPASTPNVFLDKKSLTQRLQIQKIRQIEARSKIFDPQRTL
jgi:hypothetical protein